MVKLADTPDLGSGAARRGGSSPSARTIDRFYMIRGDQVPLLAPDLKKTGFNSAIHSKEEQNYEVGSQR
jgi:hypothetical protein